MRTFKCTGCYERCCVTLQTGANPPCRCHHDDNISNWCEVKEEPTTKRGQLPKLTAEVFSRPDCPKNVQYAVVTSEGRVIGYTSKPYINTFYNMHNELTQCWAFDAGCSFTISVAGNFDSSDWQNSLIERPAKALPDWVKVGGHGFDNKQKRYFKIVDINEKGVDIEYLDEGIGGSVYRLDMQKCSEAVKRPFNDKEMKTLVGKVIENPNIVLLVNSYGKHTGDIGAYCGNYTAESLMDNGFVIDNKPCYKLKHLNEKGEWVE